MGAAVVVASTAISMYGQYQRAQAAKEQGRAAEAAAAHNALVQRQAADYAIEAGKVEAGKQRSAVSRMISRQRVAMLAQGADAQGAGVRDVTLGTATLGEADARTIENNAAREALGLKTAADTSLYEGRLAKKRADQEATGANLAMVGSLLTGYGQYKASKKDGMV